MAQTNSAQSRVVAKFARLIALGALAIVGSCSSSMGVKSKSKDAWWSHAVIYEIYPRSFQDSTGDGVGDLEGVRKRIPYLKSLGIDAIWLTPIQKTRNRDFGYDITDYASVDETLGSLEEFDALVADAGRSQLRVILDLVINHTSADHPWFRESASSKVNRKSDWYVWADGRPVRSTLSKVQMTNVHDGVAPPNNWTSSLGESSWTWSPTRKQFYYHRFDAAQPDLNWRNPAVEAAMIKVMRFWLDRGVAGFRIDAITSVYEDAADRDEPKAGRLRTDNLPETQGLARRLRSVVDSYKGDRVLIGETYTNSIDDLKKWYGGKKADGLQLPMDLQLGFSGNLRDATFLQHHLKRLNIQLGTLTPLLVLDNHDEPRSIDRAGDGVNDVAIAKALTTVLYLSRGSALTYYGAELGMRTHPPKTLAEVRDPRGLLGWPKNKGRDGERTPMQWSSSPQAGFSSSPVTWLPIPQEAQTINVEREARDPHSLLNWSKSLIVLRHTDGNIRSGGMFFPLRSKPGLLQWSRIRADSPTVTRVFINMTSKLMDINVAGGPQRLLSTDGTSLVGSDRLQLQPYGVWIGHSRDTALSKLKRLILRSVGRG